MSGHPLLVLVPPEDTTKLLVPSRLLRALPAHEVHTIHLLANVHVSSVLLATTVAFLEPLVLILAPRGCTIQEQPPIHPKVASSVRLVRTIRPLGSARVILARPTHIVAASVAHPTLLVRLALTMRAQVSMRL